jgi:hypothetical protein
VCYIIQFFSTDSSEVDSIRFDSHIILHSIALVVLVVLVREEGGVYRDVMVVELLVGVQYSNQS